MLVLLLMRLDLLLVLCTCVEVSSFSAAEPNLRVSQTPSGPSSFTSKGVVNFSGVLTLKGIVSEFKFRNTYPGMRPGTFVNQGAISRSTL